MSHPQEAYDHRYSDRDVRENPELRELALEYIRKYGGSFDPLLRIKKFLVEYDEDELPTSQVRLVLNCMRNDGAVAASLPPPKFPYLTPRKVGTGGGVVIPLQRDRRSRQHVGEKQCDNTEPHEYHPDRSDGSWCNGVPFPINRHQRAVSRGRIHWANFVTTKSGFLVHKMTGEVTLKWEPNRHDWGFASDRPVGISVKTNCKNPSWVHDGHLFREEPIHLYADEVFAKERCPRCFTVTELREGPPPPRPTIPQAVFIPPEIPE